MYKERTETLVKEDKKEKDHSLLGCLIITLVCAIPFIVSMVLYCCKLFKVLDCTWLQVFLPCIITYGACTALFILICIISLIISYRENKKSKKLVKTVKDYKDKLEDVLEKAE